MNDETLVETEHAIARILSKIIEHGCEAIGIAVFYGNGEAERVLMGNSFLILAGAQMIIHKTSKDTEGQVFKEEINDEPIQPPE